MDSSMSKALIIAAGVLLAMIVIAFMTYSFRQLGSWATEQDQALLTEQRDKFNKEYEAYDKDLMYGVDVISCLNKAKSNNDQIENNRFVTGDTYDKSYKITVKFTIKNNLSEAIRIYYIDANSKKEREYQNQGPTKDLKKIEEIFDVSDKYKNSGVSDINFDSSLQKYSKTTDIVGEYTLGLQAETSEEVKALLTISDELKQTVKNKSATSATEGSWTKAVWETPLYDLKTRRFTCSNLTYDANTGRVNYIEFTEM